MNTKLTLVDIIEQELLRVDPQTGGARFKAEKMAGPVADWMSEKFVEWAVSGMEVKNV